MSHGTLLFETAWPCHFAGWTLARRRFVCAWIGWYHCVHYDVLDESCTDRLECYDKRGKMWNVKMTHSAVAVGVTIAAAAESFLGPKHYHLAVITVLIHSPAASSFPIIATDLFSCRRCSGPFPDTPQKFHSNTSIGTWRKIGLVNL